MNFIDIQSLYFMNCIDSGRKDFQKRSSEGFILIFCNIYRDLTHVLTLFLTPISNPNNDKINVYRMYVFWSISHKWDEPVIDIRMKIHGSTRNVTGKRTKFQDLI